MFKPVKNIRVHEQIIEQIRDMIIDGTLKKGDKLPTERNLAEQLGVSRASVREALRALEIMGLVESRQGDGNFIRQSFESSLYEPISLMFMLEESKPKDILELRRMIEIEAASLAAVNMTDEQIKDLKNLVDNMKTSENEDENVQFDIQFHYKIAEASGNFLVVNILNVISNIMDKFIKNARSMIISNEENWKNLNEQHENIYNAIYAHDPNAASLAMRKHFELIDKYFD